MVARVIQIARLLIIPGEPTSQSRVRAPGVAPAVGCLPSHPPKPTVRWPDRLFWVGLRLAWPDWKSALVIVRPATVIAWHRRGFSWYWTRRSRPSGGRPQVGADVRRLIREMARANRLWDAPRIRGELLKLGFEVSERTISRLMPRRRTPPSQTWRTSSRTISTRPSPSTSSWCQRSPAGSYSSSLSWPTTDGASCMSM